MQLGPAFTAALLVLAASAAAASPCAGGDNPQDCDGLVALYKAAGGPSWTNRTGWLTGSSVCGWAGIDCEFGTTRVSSITLTANNLRGSLPKELFAADKLVQLYLDKNQLSGPIPAEISDLSHLRYLYLESNHFSGEIPATFASLTSLADLDLSFNALTGSTEPLAKLSKMAALSLHHNQFNGTFSFVAPRLQSLYINDNNFTSIAQGVCDSNEPVGGCNMARNQFQCPLCAVPSKCHATCSAPSSSVAGLAVA